MGTQSVITKLGKKLTDVGKSDADPSGAVRTKDCAGYVGPGMTAPIVDEMKKLILKGAAEKLETANANCRTVAAGHRATIQSRADELKVIAMTTKILVGTSYGAVAQTYSFRQVPVACGC